MILPVHDRVRAHVTRLLVQLYALDAAEAPPIVLEYPPNRELGDLGTPVAFELARRLRKAPAGDRAGDRRGVRHARGRHARGGRAERLSELLPRTARLSARSAGRAAAAPAPAAAKAIVEHTAINPNKAAHIGHLRNSALGDTLVRVLRFRGIPVEVQNYIDDTGVQVADVVVGFRVLEGKTLEQIRAVADSTRFDFYCWDLYARVTEWYEQDKERLKHRAETLHDIEHGGNEAADIGAFIADRIVRCHLKTMARMNVDYDLLTWEGDILRLKFWAQAFDVLKESGAVYLQNEGRLDGCWVMAIEETGRQIPNPKTQIPRRTPKEEREKVIVRSNGVVTYVGKDIAYQFWKLGLLGRDFQYRIFADGPDGPLWATCSADGEKRPSPLWRRGVRLQRDRRPAVVPAEAVEAGADRRRPPRGRGTIASFFVRNGGALARDGARAGIRAGARFRRRQAAVRRGVRPQGARGQGRRSAGHADAQRRPRGRHPQPGAERGRTGPHRRR